MRTGRNYRYAAGGHAMTAALMGAVGAYYAQGAIFIAAASLCIPALIALSFIRPGDIDYAKARNAAKGRHVRHVRVIDLAKNQKLVLFTGALALFQLADASMLPLIGENLATTMAEQSPLWMSGLIILSRRSWSLSWRRGSAIIPRSAAGARCCCSDLHWSRCAPHCSPLPPITDC